MKRTSGSSDPNSSALAGSSARAFEIPSSDAMDEPMVATNIPRPTSARKSRRLREEEPMPERGFFWCIRDSKPPFKKRQSVLG